MIKCLFLAIAIFLIPTISLADINTAKQALKSGDYARAAEEFKILAEQGNAKAQSHLGYLYYVGEGVPQSFEEAVAWYGKAAVQGDRDAQYNYAVAYAFGEGIKQDYKEAAIWYRRAAEQGHAIAQYSLGISYNYGEGVPQDEKLAAEWFMKSAEAGYENAQVMVASLYHTGDGLPKDYAKAVEWYLKAANQGNAVAQYNLGSIYRAGKGVPKNNYEAMKWYRLAAAQDYEAAKIELAGMERSIAGTTKEKITAPPTATVKKEQPVATKETGTTPAEKKTETTASEMTAATPVAQDIPEDKPDIVTAETEPAQADPEKSGDGFFGTLKNIFKSDKSEEIPQPAHETVPDTAVSENAAATSTPAPVPVVDDVQVEKTSPVITVVEEPESIKTAPETDLKTPESPAPALAAETKKPVFIPGKSTTSISDLTRPRMESLESTQGGAEISTATTAPVEHTEKEMIAGTAMVPEETIPATTEDSEEISDSEEKTGGLAGFFGRMFSSDENEPDEPVSESATESLDENAPARDVETVQEEPELHGMEEVQIAKLEVPAQTGVPLETKAGQKIEIVTENSIDILTSQAVTGDPDAQFQLAENYHKGNNVEQDFPRAFIWYRRAALQGNSEAQYNLGNMYLAGEGIEKSEVEARNWYQMAARQEHEAARNKLDSLDQGVADTPISTEVDHGTEAVTAAKQETPEEVDVKEEDEEEKGGLFGYFKNIFTEQKKPPVQEDSQLSDIAMSEGPEQPATKSEAISYSEKSAPSGPSLLTSKEVKPVQGQEATLETETTAKTTVPDTDSQVIAETSTDKNPAPSRESEEKGGVLSFFGNLFSSEENKQEVEEVATESIVEDSPAVAVNNEPVISPETDGDNQSAESVQTDAEVVALAMPELEKKESSTNLETGKTSDESLKQLEIGQIRLLAEQGDVIAQARLGYKYYVGEGVAQSYTEAMKWFRKSAVQGDAYAQYNLAVMYAFGEGTVQNMDEAVIWYRRAAKQNHAVAQYSLGFCYAFGEGVPRDEKTAAEWYLKSANQGYIPAQVMVGNSYHSGTGLPIDYPRAMQWYRKAADQGDAAAQYNLGTMYLLGQGIAQSDVEARNWYEKAAQQGHEAAQHNLDNLQRIKAEHLSQVAATEKQATGTGAPDTSVKTTKDEDLAMAADTQETISQETAGESDKQGGVFSFFGKLFSSDEDKPEDDEIVTETRVTEAPAVATGTKTEPLAETGNDVTETVKEEAGNRGTSELQIAKADIPAQTDLPIETKAESQLATLPADSIEALTSQAVAGNPDAQLQLGKNYYQGNKTGKDLSQAFIWYRRAAQQGNVDAQYTLGNMYLMGEGTEQNDMEARNWYEKAARQGHEAAQHNLENLSHAIAEKPASSDISTSSEQPVASTTENDSEKNSAYGSDDKEVKAADIPAHTAAAPPEPTKPEPVTSSIPGQNDYERGLAYNYGDGVPQNYNNAFKLFESAAKLGNASAQYQLALAYSNGHGVTRNPSVAVEWYEKAARQGLTIAQRSLGNAYLNGDGVQPNKPLALAWYSLVADQGNVLDIHRRDTLMKQMTEAEIRESENLKKQLSASLSTASTTL